MTGDFIRRAVLEMADAVAGSRIQKIRLLDSCTLIFDVYGRNGLLVLAVSMKKGETGFHLLFEKIHSAYLYSSPAVHQLHSLVHGFRLERPRCVEQCVVIGLRSSMDRHLVFDFRAFDVLVLNDAGEIVFRLLKNRPKTDASYFRSIVERIPGSGAKDSALKEIEPRKQPAGGGAQGKEAALSGERALNRELSAQFFKSRSEALVRGVLKVVKAERKKAARLLDKLLFEEEELKNSEKIRKCGELLKYNLSGIPRGASSVRLKDFKGNDIEIALDPARSPTENMHRYFERYKKLGRKKEIFGKKLAYENERLRALDRLLKTVSEKKEISLGTSPRDVLDLPDYFYFKESFRRRVERALVHRPDGRSLKKEQAGKGILRFTSGTGKIILVGRNARENEELAVRKARGNDLWFHVEAGTGSAVVLRYDRKGEFQERDILDAATLALYFSKARSQGAGTVVYTHCKYVKKPRGTKQGYVIYHHNKTRYIVLEEKTLARLVDSKIPIMVSGAKRTER